MYNNTIIEGEIWKDIIGLPYKRKYQISSHGRIRRVFDKLRKSSLYYKDGFKILRIRKSITKRRSNYPFIEFVGRKHYRIHKLVALYFVPNPYNKLEINHIDGNTFNNHFSNLEWVTHKENMSHASKNNLFPRSEDHPRAKLTNIQANEIRLLYKTGKYEYKDLSKLYKISKTQIWRILKYKTYNR